MGVEWIQRITNFWNILVLKIDILFEFLTPTAHASCP